MTKDVVEPSSYDFNITKKEKIFESFAQNNDR